MDKNTEEQRELIYIPADEIRRGDILPDVSRHPVTGVVVFPNESARLTFGGGAFIRHFSHGGPDFGFPAVRVERPA